MRGEFRVVFLALIASGLLHGCVSPPVRVKDVVADKPGYLQKNFTPGALPEEVLHWLQAADSKAFDFHSMTFDIDGSLSAPGGKETRSFTIHTVLVAFEHGMIQQSSEITSNGLASGAFFGLSYRDLFPLREQSVTYSSANANLIRTTQSIVHMDPLDASGDISFAYTTGFSGPVPNPQSLAIRCSAGDPFPASRIHPKLEGDARSLNCTFENVNGVASKKSQFAYLDKYGVAFMTGYQTTSVTATYTLKDVQIR
ncbi:MAG: hypothetical protein ABFC67_01380 [Mizugakiibacter sp.]|uniref:hypothetical protein n=1 Tax=Mizugakiibacter sp. TaxID=1972610 RepID=UPI0031C3ED7E|nr:hypothetical protein [Xanthomonadaceae bacterium]